MKQCIVLCSFIMLAVFAQAQDCSYKLKGHVEDEGSKNPLKGASLLLTPLNKTIVTDQNGDFMFDGLCAGKYVLTVSHVGCEPVTLTIDVKSNRHLDVFLPHEKNTLETVLLQSKKESLKGNGKELSGQHLEETRGLSIAQALGKINGVNLMQTGSTIAKPIIHGMHGSRILSINNGVRQEGQQWGNEHALEVDPNIAAKLTVLKAVEGLRYGSDAIGAVILIDPAPITPVPGYKAAINMAYFSNNRQQVIAASFEHRPKKLSAFGYRIQASMKRSANVQTPNYRLNNTGANELNYSLTTVWKKNNFETELFLSRFATKLGIFTGSHIGNMTDLQTAINTDRPDSVFLGQQTFSIQRPSQEATHHLLKSNSSFTKNGHRFQLKLSVQNNRRKEFDLLRNSGNKLPQMDLSVYSFSEDLVWEQPLKNGFKGTAGIALQQKNNQYAGRYFIPNYNAYTYGAFYLQKYQSRVWDVEAGLRFDHKKIHSKRLLFNGEAIVHDFNFNAMATAMSATWKPTKQWKNSIGISLASRAPQINELLSDGIHHGTATYEQGNIFLKKENAINLNAGIAFENEAKTFSFDVNLYHNAVQDFIYKKPVPAEPVLTIAGAFPKLVFEQTDARLQGLDISAEIQFLKNLYWEPQFSMLRARDKIAKDWLVLMPADRIGNGLRFKFQNSHLFHDAYIKLSHQHIFKQTRVPEKAGPSDFKAAPAAYSLIQVYASTVVHLNDFPFSISMGVQNLFNTVYRDYLNGFRYFTDEMGRNVFVQLQIPFSRKTIN